MNHTFSEGIWFRNTRKLMPKFMRVVGRVVGKVAIRDLNREIIYNEIVDIIEDDVKKSADLVNAYKNRWIDVIVGRDLFDHNPAYTTPANYYAGNKEVKISGAPEKAVAHAPQLDMSQLLSGLQSVLLDGMKETIRDAVKSELSGILSQSQQQAHVDHDAIASSVVAQIVDKMPTMSQPAQSVEKVSEIDKESKNIFINLDDGKDLKSHIAESEHVVTETSSQKANDTIKKLSVLKKKKED